MKDRHVGHTPSTIVADPENFIILIRTHGVMARVEQARLCTCHDTTGNPDWHCPLCNGDGVMYTFQRKLLVVDEDSDVDSSGCEVHPFRIPILEPIAVERLLPMEQGGIAKYTITRYDEENIYITGDPLPKPYERMRVSYYSDRYDMIERDKLVKDPVTGHYETRQTRYDSGHQAGTVFGVHGDLVEIIRICDDRGRLYQDYTFCKNKIYLPKAPPEDSGNLWAQYRYVPPTSVLVSDIHSQYEESEQWTTDMILGDCRIALEPWYELAKGDIITLLTPTLYKNELLKHNPGCDKLFELDVATIDDIIIGMNGKRYIQGQDFILKNRREVIWIGNEPEPNATISVRYGYHPSFVVFDDNPIPNTLENKLFPTIVNAKLYTKTKADDIKRLYQ